MNIEKLRELYESTDVTTVLEHININKADCTFNYNGHKMNISTNTGDLKGTGNKVFVNFMKPFEFNVSGDYGVDGKVCATAYITAEVNIYDVLSAKPVITNMVNAQVLLEVSDNVKWVNRNAYCADFSNELEQWDNDELVDLVEPLIVLDIFNHKNDNEYLTKEGIITDMYKNVMKYIKDANKIESNNDITVNMVKEAVHQCNKDIQSLDTVRLFSLATILYDEYKDQIDTAPYDEYVRTIINAYYDEFTLDELDDCINWANYSEGDFNASDDTYAEISFDFI